MTKLDDSATPDGGGMQVITRAAAILGSLAASGDQTLSALAAQTGLPKTTVHRICGALEWVGYVRTDPASGKRGLGGGLLRLAAVGRRELRSVLEPYLEQLSRDLNETVDLAVLDDGQVHFVAQHAAPRRELMAIARVGSHSAAYNMASGKVLLARLSDAEVLRRLPARLEATIDGEIKSPEALLRELAVVRETGLGYEQEELRHGICAVAVAVADVDGSAASIAVPMPAARFAKNEGEVAAALLRLRDEIQTSLRGG